jgi:hypothetical protein
MRTMTYPVRILAGLFLLLAMAGISRAGESDAGYRFYAFPLSSCDDGGMGNGRCMTVIRIGNVIAGKQDWSIRWTSKPTSPLAYRQVSANDPWFKTHATCESTKGGLLCTTIFPQAIALYGLYVTRVFTVTPDGNVRLDFASGRDGLVSMYGTIIDDIGSITKLPVPQ